MFYPSHQSSYLFLKNAIQTVKENLIEIFTKSLFVHLKKLFLMQNKTVVRLIDFTWSVHLLDKIEYGKKDD